MTNLEDYVPLANHCAALAKRLSERAVLLRGALGDTLEAGWLDVAATRLSAQCEALQRALEQGLLLPEFARLRAERCGAVEGEWLTVLLDTFSKLVRETDENSPLIEALFPHQRFDKLEKSSAQRSAYRAELTQRRRSAYVRRLEQSPDYPFLQTLLAPLDAIHARLAKLTQDPRAAQPSETLPETEATRREILEAGEALQRTWRQARSLAEAALVDDREGLRALEWEPKRRAARPRPEASA